MAYAGRKSIDIRQASVSRKRPVASIQPHRKLLLGYWARNI